MLTQQMGSTLKTIWAARGAKQRMGRVIFTRVTASTYLLKIVVFYLSFCMPSFYVV